MGYAPLPGTVCRMPMQYPAFALHISEVAGGFGLFSSCASFPLTAHACNDFSPLQFLRILLPKQMLVLVRHCSKVPQVAGPSLSQVRELNPECKTSLRKKRFKQSSPPPIVPFHVLQQKSGYFCPKCSLFSLIL